MIKRIVAVFLIIATCYACSESDDSGPNSQDEFDRSAMLINWADNIIVPAYTSLEVENSALVSATATFTNSPNEQNLQTLRTSWLNAYSAFQHVSMFEIGLAEQLRFRDRMNTYPANISEIEGFIANGTYDFSLPSTNDAQGFPALDYMLYGLGSNTSEVLSFYVSNPDASKYLDYLNDLVNSIDTLTSEVLTNWETGFRNDFVANDGSSASASVDKLTNDYILYYEKALRAGKIGIPAGVFSNDPLPTHVEALYAQEVSKELALEALAATKGFFLGKHHNTNQQGPSFKAYLDFLNTIKNGEDLSSLIVEQFNAANAEMSTLNPNFAVQIQSNNSAMLQTYDALQRNVILLKVDMLQALSIDVDFVDTDGD